MTRKAMSVWIWVWLGSARDSRAVFGDPAEDSFGVSGESPETAREVACAP